MMYQRNTLHAIRASGKLRIDYAIKTIINQFVSHKYIVVTFGNQS